MDLPDLFGRSPLPVIREAARNLPLPIRKIYLSLAVQICYLSAPAGAGSSRERNQAIQPGNRQITGYA